MKKTQEEFNGISLSWTEKELPQKERTKHVHGLHPYLGKFIPQLPEIFLKEYFIPGDTVLDPFMGSGTTLIEANTLDMSSIGIDISEFNCLMVRVKLGIYDLEELQKEINQALDQVKAFFEPQISLLKTSLGIKEDDLKTDNEYINLWYSEQSIKELLCYKTIIEKNNFKYKDVLKVILSRSARSARQAPHYELDWPEKPVKEPYYCYKHGRTCYPTREALTFINRYSKDVFERIKKFSKTKTDRDVKVLHGDGGTIEIGEKIDGIFTSPPYCGLIDYHSQHQYSYEFLGLKDLREKEIGPKEKGTSKKAQRAYIDGISKVFINCNRFLKPGAYVLIVINDNLNLYPEIIENSNLVEEERVARKVDRRTGRRTGNFSEDIIICRKP